MKKFFISFLGTMAGIWLSLLIAFFGFFIAITLAVASSTSKGGEVEKKSILHLELAGEITDRPSTPTLEQVLTGDDSESMGLNDIVASVMLAATDDKIEGIYIDCKGATLGMAQLQSVVKALHHFKAVAPEKWIYAYGESFGQGEYIISTVADSIFMNPIGQLDIHGLASTGLYFKDFLDMAGIEAQVVKVGTYKSAVEPFILDSISAPARLQQELYLGNIWGQLIEIIAQGRGVTAADVNAWADSFTFAAPTESYVSRKMVDRLVYRHEMEDILARKTDKKKPKLVTITEYCQAQSAEDMERIYSTNPRAKSKATIAVLYAVGDITESDKEGIASDRLVPEILDLADNKDIDGLILRVNSGGGSAYASEQIWEALEQFKKLTGKPFYVSMGDVAASGGYYISCGADKIYAEPVTLTGSIGIFGIIPCAQKLLNNKLGIHSSTVATNAGGEPITLFRKMTPAQAAAMQSYVDRGYELFTSRCAQGRGMSQDSIKLIAEGRVWDGLEAKRIGLVDELGGLDRAVADMGQQLDASAITIMEYPAIEPDAWAMILQAGSEMKASAMREEMGPLYPYYRAVRNAAENDALQCRMPFIEIR